MLKVPSFNRCVGFVLILHSLFTMKDLSRSLLTSEVEASSERYISLADADVDDNEDYDEGFEDEDCD